jgi:hypothetical protein
VLFQRKHEKYKVGAQHADYLSASISPQATMRFQSHINGCRDCAGILRTYRKTIELTRSFLHLPDLALRPLAELPGHDRRVRFNAPVEQREASNPRLKST